jgi:voltage-gated potassium channel
MEQNGAKRKRRAVSKTTQRVQRAAMAICAVLVFGTVGFAIIEGWSIWKSFYFTLVTITTVGYGDYGLSEGGQKFGAIILVLGVVVFTMTAGQLLRDIIELQNDWERRMQRQISHLQGHYIICGLGRLGFGLCEDLEDAGVMFVVIDNNRERCEDAARRGWITVVGDSTEEETLGDANIEHARGIACLTSSDAVNTVTTLAAHELRPDLFIISRAESDVCVRRLKRAGASRVVSPVRSGGRSIARLIAQPHLANLLEGDADEAGVRLAEIRIDKDSPLDGHSLRDFGGNHQRVVVVSVRSHDGSTQHRPGVDETFSEGDVLIAASDVESLGRFAMAVLPMKQAA